MGGLLTPRPHCPPPGPLQRGVGADWSEVNLQTQKTYNWGDLPGTTGVKAEVSLFWDPRSAQASQGEPSQWGRGGSVCPEGLTWDVDVHWNDAVTAPHH